MIYSDIAIKTKPFNIKETEAVARLGASWYFGGGGMMVEVEQLEQVMKIIGTHGLAPVIAIVMIWYLIFENKKSNEERLKRDEEIISTMILLKENIVDGYVDNSKLKIFVRVLWIRLIQSYEKLVLWYIINNSIQKNRDNILNELSQEVTEILDRINELLLMFTSNRISKIYYELILKSWEEIHLIIIDVFDSATKCEDIDYKELARTLKTHIEKEQARVLKLINETKI